MIIFTYAYALHMCMQWWLMTVTCGGVASSNQTCMKTKLHHVVHNDVDCYYTLHLPFYEPIVRFLSIAVLQ